VRVYVASPLGFSEATRAYNEILLAAVRGAGHEPLDPWANAPVDPRAIGARNEHDIRSADAVLALLDGTDIDSGVAAEIGFAAALGTPVIGLRLDFRQAGDMPGAIVNLQVEHWLTGPVHRTLEAALEALERALGGGGA
jgi:nucleoside 2-deoxyribosyltransferase